eukprot:TRINITY_DN4521_c0_g1_i1.p1 TRINITY_DN4521_c0_g1~~TRINITY_DN4521_c0_g1_i1.p1  ORF type:complete len:115 (-),score=20.90 TRINITY_DN4521_c0_g1_i1:21-365(-)
MWHKFPHVKMSSSSLSSYSSDDDTSKDVRAVKDRIANYKARREKRQEDYELRMEEQPGEVQEYVSHRFGKISKFFSGEEGRCKMKVGLGICLALGVILLVVGIVLLWKFKFLLI